MRARLPLIAGIALACAVSALYAFSSPGAGLDYGIDAGPPIDALARGDLGAFFATQPLMGSVSILLRAPFAARSTPLAERGFRRTSAATRR